MSSDEELFGDPGKVALMKRSAALWSLLKDDPAYSYYGRVVALSDHSRDTAAILCALASLQGAAVAYYFPKHSVDALFASLQARGYATDRHEHFRGGEKAYEASREILARHSLPGDLAVTVLDGRSEERLVSEVAALCQSCGVMPVPGAVMRGISRAGINIVAVDGAGDPVASASSFALHHPASPHAGDVFWGMLATREDRRGEKIALVLGAMAIVHMWQKEGARGFMTGVRQDNASSQALCHKLGVTDTEWVYAQCLDTGLLGGMSVTK